MPPRSGIQSTTTTRFDRLTHQSGGPHALSENRIVDSSRNREKLPDRGNLIRLVLARGLNFLRRRKSSFIHGAGDDGRELTDHLAAYLGAPTAHMTAV